MSARLWLIVVAFAVALVLTLVVLTALPFDVANERVQQAAIAGLVVAIGWIASFAFRELSAYLVRRERLRDIHRALFAEIKHNLRNLGEIETLVSYGDRMIERTLDGDDFIPFVAHERSDSVFQSVLGEIQLLPRSSIDILVEYYGHVSALEALIGDLRGETVRSISPRRRADLYADYISIKVRLVLYGRDAMRIIDIYAKKGSRAARAEADRLERARVERERADTAPAQ